MDNIAISITDALMNWGIHPQIITVLISMIPLLELRGSILVVGGFLGLPFVPTYITAVIGNMVPIPFILLFIESIFNWMKSKEKLKKIPLKLEEKTMKRSSQIEKYGYFGLLLFVGIPLPGTGAWTGALLAVLMGLNKKKSLLYIFFGVLLAGLIMTILAALIRFGLIAA